MLKFCFDNATSHLCLCCDFSKYCSGEDAVQHSQPISTFFAQSDVDMLENEISAPIRCGPCSPSKIHAPEAHFKDVVSALNHLETHEALVSKSKVANEKNKIDKFSYVVALAVKLYLTKRRNNVGMLVASQDVAELLFNSDPSIKTYKSTCVRNWATHYMQHGRIPGFKQGCHVKTTSVVLENQKSSATFESQQ